MIGSYSKLGRNEQLAAFVYLHGYFIASYKLEIVLTLQITVKLFLNSYSFSCVSS